MYKIIKKSIKSKARIGVYKTKKGDIKTPFFMPVATQGVLKHISVPEIKKLKPQILLSNTYHLMLRPGEEMIKKIGNLNVFMGWDGPILTDSGGFQVFSLAGNKKRTGENLVKITKDGVDFKSYINGSKYNLTPEKSLKIQRDLGVDIAVCLDECVALPSERRYIEESVELTTRWARKTKSYLNKLKGDKPKVHCVIQGGLDRELRLKSLRDLVDIGFDGYNIGGLSVGESPEEMYKVLDYLAPEMPENNPRYLMGVGYPENIIEAVRRGVDMFDCVIPTREGRHGRMFMRTNDVYKKSFYKVLNITNSQFSKDFSIINTDSKIEELRSLSKAYLHYLFKIKEPLGLRLASLNNLEFYLDMMRDIRKAIKDGKL